MFDDAARLLQWLRSFGQRLFLHFGFHCATHQIRIILVSCVVITSLFYPALAIYASSQSKSLSIVDTFVSPSTVPELGTPGDLVNLWSCHQALRVHEDAVTRAKCGVGRALRVERLLIQGPVDEDVGAINHQTLQATLDLENRLEQIILDGATPCLKRANGRCLVLSPLLFWNHDAQTLLYDDNLVDTIRASQNISLGGFVVTPQMVLAHRGSHEPQVAGSKFDFAEFLAVTYFFPASDCLGNSEHTSWLQSVQRALAQKPEPVSQRREPLLIALEYDLSSSKGEAWSALSAFLYLAYIGFLGYVVWSVGKMTAVHSRLGVAFTALVEIACSTITSLSVCALVGFKITMVPWEVLPIVIMFVGAENMFNLVDAVCRTPVTLSVKQRIAEGLSRAGTSNTLKVVTYNIILGVIAVFSVGTVRQFCSFAIVVLVAHWFLAHTFFLAVLSIDIQRLELDELLRHDPSTLVPLKPQESLEQSSKTPQSTWQKFVFPGQSILKSRATTNLSLLMLLAIAGTLYYTTYTSSSFDIGPSSASQLTTTIPSRVTIPSPHLNKSAAWHIWKTLNPSQASLLYLRLEGPSVIDFTPDLMGMEPNRPPRTRFSMRSFRLVFWLLKIMVLPIALTTTILWRLLLYLLKDAELLEAQRNRAGPSYHDSPKESKIREGQVTFSTLPRTFTSDVELIAASKDGNTVVSIGLRREITVWRIKEGSHVSIDISETFLEAASTWFAASTITCVAINSEGRYCALGTGAGMIAVWTFENDIVNTLPLLFIDNMSAAVSEIQFASFPSLATPRQSSLSPSSRLTTEIHLLATYSNGIAAQWSLEETSYTCLRSSRPASVAKSSLVPIDRIDRHLVAFSMNDGTIEVIDPGDTEPWISADFCVQAGDPLSIPSRVSACAAQLGGKWRHILVVATETGMVSLWDGSTAECISVFDDTYGNIDSLQMTAVQCETCRLCGQLPLESVSVAFSVDHVIQVFRLYLNDQTRRCSCSHRPLRQVIPREALGRRSRSNSNASQPGPILVSPSIPRARLATTVEVTSFPVSAHGVHSRRVTEKELGRRSSEMLAIPFPSEERDADVRIHLTSASSFWHNAVLTKVTNIPCERGVWGVAVKCFAGIRRKPRTLINARDGTVTKLPTIDSRGLTLATLERWEVWTFDPSASRLQSSALATLSATSSSSPFPVDHTPRLPFTRVTPFSIAHTHAFAGFGNTVGVFSFS